MHYLEKVIVKKPGGPECMEVVSEPIPRPGEGQVLIRTAAIAVGWPDVLIRRGSYRWMPPYPVTLGNELTGVVEEVGKGVTSLCPGQKVYLGARELNYQSGCYASHRVVPAKAVIPLTDQLNLETALGLGYLSMAWALIYEANRGFDPKTVLIVGAAGGAGCALVQMAREAGFKIIGTVSNEEKASLALSLGASHIVNYRRENVVDRVRELTADKGVDLIIDPVVGPAFNEHFSMLNRWGSVVVYNASGGPPPPDMFDRWRAHSAQCHGMRYFSMHVYEGDAEGRRRIMEVPLELLKAGRVTTPIAARFALSDAHHAHELLESGSAAGKIVLIP